jgi:hypothetical protein
MRFSFDAEGGGIDVSGVRIGRRLRRLINFLSMACLTIYVVSAWISFFIKKDEGGESNCSIL